MTLRPLDFNEASAYSPWPDRIIGKVQWIKKSRTKFDIETEYNRVYQTLEEDWTKFVAGLSAGEQHPAAFLRFYDGVRRKHNQRMTEMPEIYGNVDPKNYLVSADDRLYLADLELFDTMARQLVIETVQEMRAIEPFTGVLEIGSGTGVNMLNLHLYLGLRIAGCDLSTRAVTFLQRMAVDAGVDAECTILDFLGGDISRAAPTPKWALISVHALEQAPSIEIDWFARVAGSRTPPVFGIHLEPLQINDGSQFAGHCRRYAEINLYNTDFHRKAHEAQALGLIKIVHERKRVLGCSAFNPTSVLVWKPSS